MLNAEVRISTGEVLGAINPFVYGNFIEFINDCINEGMWAQLVKDRGFEEADTNQDGIAGPWLPAGYNDTARYLVDPQNPYNSRHSQKVEITQHGDGWRGIKQHNLPIHFGETYLASLWLRQSKVPGPVTVSLGPEDDDAPPYALWEIPTVGAGWSQYTGGLTPMPASSGRGRPGDQVKATLRIGFAHQGTVWIDQVSLLPATAVGGVWPEVVEATRRLLPGSLRFPGGCFADAYHWEDGVGPRDARPVRENRAWPRDTRPEREDRAWQWLETNEFGTDEFIELCRATECEPVICVNFGSGSPEEAAGWVAYCNSSSDSDLGRRRAANGYQEPHAVRSWEIGNETWGTWEIGHTDAATFAHRYLEFYQAMKAVDPDIRIIACGGNGNDPEAAQAWHETLLGVVGDRLDYLTLHFYAPQVGEGPVDARAIYEATMAATLKYERVIEETKALLSRHLGGSHQVQVAVTEWNTMYVNNSLREQTLEAALFNASFLNLMLRHADQITMAHFSDLVNGWQGGCIRSRRGEVYRTPSYHVLARYANHPGRVALRTDVAAPTFASAAGGHVPAMPAVPYLDAQATAVPDGSEVWLFLVNRHPSEAISTQVRLAGRAGSLSLVAHVLRGTSPGDRNSFAEPERICFQAEAPKTVGPGFTYVAPAHSVAAVQLRF